MHWAVEHGKDINIHFHTFEPANLRGLLEALGPGAIGRKRTPPPAASSDDGVPAGESGGPASRAIPRFNWEIVDFAENFPVDTPNGVLAVLRVHKGWRARADAAVFRLRTAGEPRAVLRHDAQPFAEWAANPADSESGR
jgi:hypothetical protein